MLSFLAQAGAQTIVDADTVDVAGQRMRLHGIDVPDEKQTCGNGKWFPRSEATAALIKYVGDRKLDCFQVGFNYKAHMPEALCFAGTADLQAFLLANGWAWVVRPGSLRYIDLERNAEKLRLGVHGHDCLRADRWRRRNIAPN